MGKEMKGEAQKRSSAREVTMFQRETGGEIGTRQWIQGQEQLYPQDCERGHRTKNLGANFVLHILFVAFCVLSVWVGNT